MFRIVGHAAEVDAIGGELDTLALSYPDLPDLDAYLAHVEARLPPDRNVVLVGESFSGPIVLALLARGRARYTGAVLSTTFDRPPLGLVVSLAHKLRLSSFVLPAVSEQILRVFCLNGVADLGLIRHTIDVVREIRQPTIASRLRALAQMHEAPPQQAPGVPVLVLRASRDRVVRRRFVSGLAERLPGATLRDIDGPHLLLQAAPERCAGEIRAFVAGLG